MKLSKSKLRLAMATLCAFSLAAAACGSDSDETDVEDSTVSSVDGDSEETPDDPDTEDDADGEDVDAEDVDAEDGEDAMDDDAMAEATGTPVKIGLIFGGTGRTAGAFGFTDDTASAWTTYWNSHGGVDGHPVEVVAIDMEGDVAVAAAAARELVEIEEVVGVMIQDSNTEGAVSEYLAEQGVPVIGGTSNNFDPVGAPNTQFPMSTTPPGSYALNLASAQAAGFSHFTGIVCSEAPSCPAADEFYEANTAAFELDYTKLVLASHAEPSYTSFCLAVTGDGEDLINLAFTPDVVVTVAQECVAQGFEGSFNLPANTIDAAALDEAGDVNVVGFLNGFPWWAETPAVETFRAVMAESAPDVEFRSPSVTNTWSTLELFRTALTATPAAGDDITVEDVLAAYYALDGETLDGLLSAPASFIEGEGPQAGVPCGWLIEYSDGVFSSVTLGDSANGAEGDLQSYCYEG